MFRRSLMTLMFGAFAAALILTVGGALLGIGAIAQILFGLLIGYVVDKLGKRSSRVDSLAVAASIGAVWYGAMFFESNHLFCL